MKNKITSFFIILSLVSNSFGIDIPPSADGSKFFNSATVQEVSGGVKIVGADENTSIVSDDNLSKKDISQGLAYKQNLGVANGRSILTKTGGVYYMTPDANGTYPSEDNLTKPTEQDRMLDPTYKAWYDQYKGFVDDNLTVKRANENISQRDSMNQTYKYGNTVNSMKDRFISGNNPLSSGQSVTQLFRTNINKKGNSTQLIELEKNATTMYKDLYSSNVSIADKENLLNKNYGAVATAYQGAEALGKELTSRMTAAKIKCQIVRELVPSFMCPLPGKDGIQYPGNPDMNDLRKVNVVEAKANCNHDCWTEPGELSCIPKHVLNSKDITMPATTIIAYPNWSETTSSIEIPVSTSMPVENLSFTIKIPNTSSSGKTDEEWESFVAQSGFKVRYSVLEENIINTNDPWITIIDRSNVNILSSQQEITVPINRIMTKFKIKIWQPYISNNPLEAYRFKYLFDALTTANSSITVSGFASNYTSDSIHFCQPLQMVGSPGQCTGEVVPFTTGDDQFNFLCLADSKKIGPEPTFGGFFSAEACERRCIRHEECTPTYRNYATANFSSDQMYKAKISCLDDDENTNCTTELCEALFADQERPINEILVHNDDTMVYTVKNKSLTDTIRPKIDLGAELSNNPDYDQVFENEQKDAAYMSMLEKQSYNRIAYRIGDESPSNLAYHKNKITDLKSEFYVDLKPKSFDIDSGKTFNIYSVIKLDHSFTPIAGTFHLNNHDVTAGQTNIQFKDISYLIKTNNLLGGWEVFRRDEWAKVMVDTTAYGLSPSGSLTSERFLGWVSTPQYKISSFAKLNSTSGDFEVFDSSQRAPAFTTEIFKNEKDFYKYKISEWIESDMEETPGSLIHSQLAINHDTWIKKIYIDTPIGPKFSIAKDYTVYLVYSEQPLSYHEIMKEIEGPSYESVKIEPEDNKWGAYNLLTSQLFRSKSIKYDGELTNQVKPLIMGTKDNTTVSVELIPGLSEKGKKVFKFLFLYEDAEANTFGLTNP